MYSLIFLAGSSFLLALVLTPVVRRLAWKAGWVDHPDRGRHRHEQPIPRLGGVAIALSYLGALVALLFSGFAASEIVAAGMPLALKILPAALLILIVGLLDDLKGLRPRQKLCGQLLAASVVFFAGVRITGLSGLSLDAWISLPVTLLWLVACTNAFNLIDGVDGLAAGVGLFATITIVTAAFLHGNIPLALATVPLAGSLLGFLRYNFSPASIFLGDSGSLLIGFLLGCYGIIWSQKSATLLGMTAPLMALALPILDTVLSVLRRLLRGQPIFEADRGHIHHRLLDLGLTPRRVAVLLYGVCGLFAALSLLESVSENRYTGVIIVLFCAVAWIGVQNLGYVEFGVARRMLLGGAFQKMLNGQVALKGFEDSLTKAHTVEDCWTSLCEAARKLGFKAVRMRLAGKNYEKQTGTGGLGESWNITIRLSPDEWVDLTREFRSPVLPMVVTPFVDILHRELPLKLKQLQAPPNALPTGQGLLAADGGLEQSPDDAADWKRILIYGAGSAGTALMRGIAANPSLHCRVLGFLDDDPVKKGAVVMGVPVLGSGQDARKVVERYKAGDSRVDEIVIAMPSATAKQMKEAVANCSAAGVSFRIMPGIGELLEGKTSLTERIGDISLEDLLGREPVRLDEGSIRSALAGRCVLVTGAAGQIGSEICRQVASFGPSLLVAFDQAESALFEVERQLHRRFPQVSIVPCIGDVRDEACVDQIIRRYSVETIFHAAAYTCVPLMELHPLEVVKTNVLGTWNLARAAAAQQVSNFVMVSSDKAVNPSSVMGLTKRVAEMIVASMSKRLRDGSTRFVSVRFGDVLGSNASVTPIFQQRIANGGALKAPDPAVRRCFMTAREAVQLVLQASTMGEGTETFVLDMGEPVAIADLARNTIQVAGLDPDEEIEIRYIGLRPGEKIIEESTAGTEELFATEHKRINALQADAPDLKDLIAWIRTLQKFLADRDEVEVVAWMTKLVPEYQPVGLWANIRSAYEASAALADAG